MNQKIGMSDFFGMEASEYLEKLDALISGNQRPAPDEFVRLARALRGSAMMASQQTIAEAGAALESFARALHENRLDWNDTNKQLAIRSVDELKILVRKLGDWAPEDEQKIKSLAAELVEVAGDPNKPGSPDASGGLDTGTRAFIGREGAAVASALQRASRTAGSGYTTPEVVEAILEAIQPLRGIASLGDVPPMPDLLDGVERIAGECKNNPDRQNPRLKEIFATGAEAIARVAREVAATGIPDPDSEEASNFARLLRHAFGAEQPLRSIEKFYYDDAGPHILSRGSAPSGVEMAEAELVAHGEHLKLAADELEQASSKAQRNLRLQALESRLVTLAANAGSDLAGAVAKVASQFQSAIAEMTEDSQTGWLASHLRSAADALADAVSETEAAVVERLQAISDAVAAGEQEPEPTVAEVVDAQPPAEMPAAETPEPAAEPVAETELQPEAVAKAPTVEETVPAVLETSEVLEETPKATTSMPEGHDLAASFTTYESMLERLGSGNPSIEDLLAGPPQLEATETPELVPTPTAAEVEPELPVETAEHGVTAEEVEGVAIVEEATPAEPEEIVEPAAPAESVAAVEEAYPADESETIAPDPAIEATVAEPAGVDTAHDEVVPIEEYLVPITDFCYSGRVALVRALSLKTEIHQAISADIQGERVTELVDEVLDLIELGIDDGD